MKRALLILGSCFVASMWTSCHNSSDNPPAIEPDPDPRPDPDPEPEPPNPVNFLGEPLPGLTTEEYAAFDRGKELFSKRFKPSEGMGPLYNATSCASCHSKPVPGGGAELYRNFYVAAAGFTFVQFPLEGLPSVVVPSFGSVDNPNFTLEGGRPRIPDTVGSFDVFKDQRNSIPTFGVGLFERISDATILANADPDDTDGDGISGRANNDGAGLGRLGTKAQSNNIELFVRAPLFNQMGITTMPFQGDGATASLGHGAFIAQASGNPNDPTEDLDAVPDPELAASDLGDLIAFARFMAPPRPRDFSDAAKRGEESFVDLGCAKCHIPALDSTSGPVRAYTDLLIHDMGPELAGEVTLGTPQMGSTTPSTTAAEWRTAPLWGVSHSGPWLHDGRAPTLDEAIMMHGGEAQAIRDAYAALSQDGRDDILEFLRHL